MTIKHKNDYKTNKSGDQKIAKMVQTTTKMIIIRTNLVL